MHPAVKIPPDCPSGLGTGAVRDRVVGGCAKDQANPPGPEGMPGAGLTSRRPGQAGSDRLALKPYWGKPTIRNFRGGDGDVGIIRSPVRAIALPDVQPHYLS